MNEAFATAVLGYFLLQFGYLWGYSRCRDAAAAADADRRAQAQGGE